MTRAQWVERHAPLMDDVRAALDWAFAPGGDATLGVELTISSFALGRQMLLVDEFTRRVETVIDIVMASGTEAGSQHLRLSFLIGCLGAGGDTRLTALASRLEDAATPLPDGAATIERFAAANSLWALAVARGDFHDGVKWSDRLVHLAQAGDDPVAHLVAGRIQAQTLHFLGRHAEATGFAQRVIGEAWRTIPLIYNPSPVELRVSMRVVLARALWMQGFPVRAAEMAREAMAQSRTDSPLAQCQAIVMGSIVVAMWSGLDADALELSTRVVDVDTLQGFGYWLRWGTRFREVLALRAGGDAPARPADFFEEPDFILADHLATMDERWLSATCIRRVASGMVGWCAPEALRLQGERALRGQTVDGLALGESLLERSLVVAREQGAASWELRAAISLARHWRSRERERDARALLEPVLARFTEGFETADWRAADRLLSAL